MKGGWEMARRVNCVCGNEKWMVFGGIEKDEPVMSDR